MLNALDTAAKSSPSYDAITGVLDRVSFLEKLETLVARGNSTDFYTFGITSIEQFRLINLTYGYKAGDYVLNIVAKTMSLELDENTIIGRLGSDEFGIISQNKKIAQIQAHCESMNYSLVNIPIVWDERNIHLHVKFGLVNINHETQDCDQLLRHANEAIYAAQHKGRPMANEYSDNDNTILRRSSSLQEANKLQQWIARDQFLLYVQPIVHLNNPEEASHYELLIRGKSDTGEIILPGKLIDAAEDFNLTPMLDKWVIRSLFSWLKSTNKAISPTCKFSFNLSALSINDEELITYIIKLVNKEKIDATNINIEITERVAIANMQHCHHFMTALKDVGFTFSLDDFGSGYSSFKYIQMLPFDVIKIDGTFIENIHTNQQNRVITKSINDIAKAFGKKTVAEYVTCEQVATVVKQLGIDYGQGYYFSKPHPITKLLDTNQ